MSLVLIITIIICSGYYYTLTAVGKLITPLALCICLGILIMRLFYNGKFRVHEGKLLFSMYFISVVLIYAVICDGTITLSVIKEILIILCALLITSIYSFSQFKRAFVKTMIILSVSSLFFYVLFMTPIADVFPSFTNYNNVEYVHNFLYSGIHYDYIGISNRLNGVFWEPGLYATFLILAILFCEFENKKKYILTLLLFFVTLVLTRSGAALLILPIILIIKLTTLYKRRTILSDVLIISGIAVFFVLAITVSGNVEQFLDQYLFNKLSFHSDSSTSARANAFDIDLKVFWKHFPFGTGLFNYTAENTAMAGDGVVSYTSTLTGTLAQYGIFAFPILGVWLKGIFTAGRKKGLFSIIGYAAIILIILSKEPHTYILATHVILMYFAFDGDKNESTKTYSRQRKQINSLKYFA